MGLSRNKVAVSEGAAGSPPFYGESAWGREFPVRKRLTRIKLDGSCCSIFNEQRFIERKIVSVINAEGPLVPIPNTEVKLCSGENTLWETVREDSPMLTSTKEATRFLC